MTAAGIAGLLKGTVQEGIKFVNTGNVTATGVVATAADKTSGVAGVVAIPSKPIPYAECYCTVNAIGYQGAGMITGATYAAGATQVLSGGVGGKIAREMIEGVTADDDPINKPMIINLGTESNIDDLLLYEWNDYWYKYVYSAEITEEEATGLELLASAPVVELPAMLPATE
jgi:hypothetical protein